MTRTAAPDGAGDDAGQRREAHRAIGLSAAGLALTGAVELVLALLTGSVALLGDALHNLSDVSTSAVVYLGFWISRRAPSPTHPYGYERAEDLAGLGVALVIWLSAGVAGYESWHKLVGGGGTGLVGVGMVGALAGVVGNQAVARYKGRVGRRIRSVTLIADARHSWLDALSSVGALIGLGVVATGHRWGDPVAGFAVTLFILHVGWEVTGEVLHHLMDGVDPTDLDAARQAAGAAATLTAVTVRGRWMGRSLVLEVEGLMPEEISLAEAERVGLAIERAVLAAVPAARRVRVTPRAGTAQRPSTTSTPLSATTQTAPTR
jgi:cation diffusion facilitator family transporter